MKKNESLSEEVLEKVSAGNKFFNAFDFISENNRPKESDNIITFYRFSYIYDWFYTLLKL